ncbi:MAG: hypothetical protein EOM15_06645 [Spirochaetia bacterium]|nr:hypothetical protein [Spirochaetia bacterium]
MNTRKTLLLGLLLMLATYSLTATTHNNPYLTFTKGNLKGEVNQTRYYEISLGTTVTRHAAVEAFGLVHNLVAREDQDSVDLLSLIAGLKAEVKLFKDATLNPLLQAGIGQMVLLYAQSAEQNLQTDVSFYSSLATGFEINIFDTVRIQVLSGYRFCPHREIGCLKRDTLSSPFSSISIRAMGRYASN